MIPLQSRLRIEDAGHGQEITCAASSSIIFSADFVQKSDFLHGMSRGNCALWLNIGEKNRQK
jgi:hypothetical protein